MANSGRIFKLQTNGPGLYEFTGEVAGFLRSLEGGTGGGAAGGVDGVLVLFVRHTSCSLLIQENADPDVQTDMLAFFRKLVPEGEDWMIHTLEGPDDMPAHIKSALTQTTLTIPIVEGRLALGTWQGIYLFEHRRRPHQRQIVIHQIGEG